MAMKAVGVMQVAPAGPDATAERLGRAWDHATYLVRRATVLAAATSLVVGATAPAPVAVRGGMATTGVLFVLASLVDVHERRLPNRLLAAALLAALASVAVGPSVGDTAQAAIGAAFGGGLVLGVRLVRGIGMGDVKMAAVVGASVGYVSIGAVPVAIAVAAAVAAGVGLVGRRTSLPFGPALWLGWAVVLTATSMGWWT